MSKKANAPYINLIGSNVYLFRGSGEHVKVEEGTIEDTYAQLFTDKETSKHTLKQWFKEQLRNKLEISLKYLSAYGTSLLPCKWKAR